MSNSTCDNKYSTKTSFVKFVLVLMPIFTFFALLLSVPFCAYADDDDFKNFSNRKLLKQEREFVYGKTFTVAYNGDHKPFQYIDKNNEAKGTIVSLLNALAKKYGFKVIYKLYDEKNAQNSNYDIIIATIADLHKISNNYKPTLPYHEEHMMIIFPKRLTLQKLREEQNIIGILDYTVDFSTLYSEFPLSYLKKYPTTEELLIAYDTGTVDAAMFSRTLLDASMQGKMSFVREHYSKLNTMITSEIEIPQRFFISNNLAEKTLPLFNAMLSDVDYTKTLLNDAKPHLEAMPFSTPTYIRVDIILSLIVFTILIVLALFQFRIYKIKQNQRKNQKINTSLLMPFNEFSQELEKKLPLIQNGCYELIGIDIDLFRLVVAYYGNETAEKLLDLMSEMIKSSFDVEDSLLTRYNKDYFLIFKRKIDDGSEFKNFVLDELTPRFKEITGKHYSVSFSVGTYIISDTHISLSDMITFSELARRQGKNIHTSTFYTFDEVMNKQYQDKLNITYRMIPALANKEFILEYQPKIDLQLRKITGAEALVRWKPQNGSTIYPNEFIPIFEKNGFIHNLDLFVFEEVCKFMVENKELCSHIKIAVNLSPYTLSNSEIINEILALTVKYNISPLKFELEVVESVIDDMPLSELIQKINEFKEHGFSIALDDFGSGASSLNRFGLLPLDVIKFDKKFIDNLDNERIAYTVKNFISNSKELNLITVAEGIETKEQLALIEESHCDIAQGYLFSRPLSKEIFIQKLKEDLLYLM